MSRLSHRLSQVLQEYTKNREEAQREKENELKYLVKNRMQSMYARIKAESMIVPEGAVEPFRKLAEDLAEACQQFGEVNAGKTEESDE